MKIFAAIDLHNGEAVRLYKGDYKQVTVYGNPKEIALEFQQQGVKYLHLVDLDGAKLGNSKNIEAVKEILNSVDMFVEFGGGIRKLEEIENLLSLGLNRVILGSKALDFTFVDEAVKRFGPQKIVAGIDTKDYMVATHGWISTSDVDATSLARHLYELGIETVIFTDIAMDGTLSGINEQQTKKLIDESEMKVIASGGAKSLEDIRIAKEIGCEGIILGKSIYEKTINLEEAIVKFGD